MGRVPPNLSITPADALDRQRMGAALIDIREAGERATGMARAAIGVAMGELLDDPARWIPDHTSDVMLICASGRRSLTASKALTELGYVATCSVDGGTTRWRAEHLPMRDPDESAEFLDRYSRHLLLPEVGLVGQRKLRDARVALIGAGGLGSPAALYLAAAGIGHLTLIDNDVVERSNLQRQIVHRDAAIGQLKVESARDTLLALNPDIRIDAVAERVVVNNVDALLSGHDVILDGCDNFATRYLVNDACVRFGLPLIYGAVERFTGQVAVFWSRDDGQPRSCYRCLFPEPPPAAFAPNCAEAGVLGVLPGLIGMLQATEAIKLVLNIGEPLIDCLLRVDVLRMRFDRVVLTRDSDCGTCGDGELSPVHAADVGCEIRSG